MMTLLRYLKAPKDGLLDLRGFLVNEVPSYATEQINVSSLSRIRDLPSSGVHILW